jgi:hypothetical protein
MAETIPSAPQKFARGQLPETGEFRLYRKATLTQAVRIDGPFVVETQEGWLICQDGWLALDSRGWPYPIDATEFERIYAPAFRAILKDPNDDREAAW